MAEGVVITGCGVISSVGHESGPLLDALLAGRCGVVEHESRCLGASVRTRAGLIADFDPEAWIADDTMRRMSRFTQFAIAAGRQAAVQAGLIEGGPGGRFDDGPGGPSHSPGKVRAERTGVLCGAMAGAPGYVLDYYAPIVERGITAANPLLFGEGVPNAASSHLSMSLGITGGCQTLLGDRNVGLDAIALGAELVRGGRYDVVLAGASEEYHPILTLIHERIGMHAPRAALDRAGRPFSRDPVGYLMGEGAAMVVLERADHAAARGADVLARIRAVGFSTGAGLGGRRSESTRSAIRDLLRARGAEHRENPLIFSSANGSALDAEELRAISSVAETPLTVTSIAGAIGECLAMTPVASVVAAVGAARRRLCPPTLTTDAVMPAGLHCPSAQTSVDSTGAIILATALESGCTAIEITT